MNMKYLAFLFLFFLIILKLSATLNWASIKVFRVLFPSWKFFESLTPIPKIYYRYSSDQKKFTDWLPLKQSIAISASLSKRLAKIFHYPEGNLSTFTQGQIEQFLNDVSQSKVENGGELESLVSYKIVNFWIRSCILERHKNNLKIYQYKIGVLEFKSNEFSSQPEWTESILSPLIEV